MKIAFDSSGIDEKAQLSEPVLPQASGGILDLSSPSVVAFGAVKVEIPPYAQLGWGDRVTVVFTDQSRNDLVRFAYLPNPVRFEDQEYVAEVRVQPLSALASSTYDVTYSVASRTGNISNSAVNQVKIINAPHADAGRLSTVDTTFFGTYPPGVIGSWVVPADYTLSTDSDIAVRSLNMFAPSGRVSPDVLLNVRQAPPLGGSKLIATIQSSDGQQWTVRSAGETHVALDRGDLISIELSGNQNARFFVALAL
jgi:hypothetical protein